MQYGASSLHNLANKAKSPPSRGNTVTSLRQAIASLRQPVASLLEITKPPYYHVSFDEHPFQADIKPLQIVEALRRGSTNCLQSPRISLWGCRGALKA